MPRFEEEDPMFHPALVTPTERIYYRHVPTGEIRSGLYLGPSSQYNDVWLLCKDNNLIVAVHTDNVVKEPNVQGYNPTLLSELPEYRDSRDTN